MIKWILSVLVIVTLIGFIKTAGWGQTSKAFSTGLEVIGSTKDTIVKTIQDHNNKE